MVWTKEELFLAIIAICFVLWLLFGAEWIG